MSEPHDLEDWLNRWDMQSVPDLDDKVRECEFFFELLTAEGDRNKFRWFLSGFLNAAYSFFESSALTAYFRYTDPEGESHEDDEGLAVLSRHVKVTQNKKNPIFVKTAGITPLTKQLYDIRKKNTHHFPLSIMATGASLPEDFHLGSMQGEGIPAMPFCRDVLHLIRIVYADQ
ncbi:hypothetical protein [Undibacterium sp. RuTC16W]|uniref:hypothetical protein n=1 Tax=Undibacterium sp. RuTC16W TaxID=3413048 RepID=UPI003BF39C93